MPKSDNCFQLPYNHKAAEWGCNIGSNKDKIDFILFGDSHSLALKDVFDEYAGKNNLRIFFTGSSACIPFLGVYTDSTAEIQKRNNCYELNKRVSEFASEEKVAGIILSARWAYYINGGYVGESFKFNAGKNIQGNTINNFNPVQKFISGGLVNNINTNNVVQGFQGGGGVKGSRKIDGGALVNTMQVADTKPTTQVVPPPSTNNNVVQNYNIQKEQQTKMKARNLNPSRPKCRQGLD